MAQASKKINFSKFDKSMTGAHAIGYARMGWHVFPLHNIEGEGKRLKCSCGSPSCKSPGKHPRIEGGHTNATTSEDQIREWWNIWPDANIGMNPAKSGAVVIDVDPRNGGVETLTNLLQQHGKFDHTLAQYTGGGGHHTLMSAKPGMKYPGKLGPGVDVKHNGFVVLAPSNHASGRKYRWVPGHSPFSTSGEAKDIVMPFAPAWMEKKPITSHQKMYAWLDDSDPLRLPSDKSHSALAAHVNGLLAAIVPEGNAGYHDWLRVGMALHATFNAGDDGLDLWHEWSEDTGAYDPDEIERKWRSFAVTPEGVKLETLEHMARANGWRGTSFGQSDGAGFGAADESEDDDEEPEPAKAGRFSVNTIADILSKGFTPVTYLWPDLLATNTLTVVWGKDGASKTSLAISESLPHAYGINRDGEPIERFGTLLVSLESVQDTENLIHGWLRANPRYASCGVEPAFAHMAAIGSGLHCRNLKPGDLEKAIKRRLKELSERFGVPFKVVVLDTLSMALLSDDGDESNESVNRTFTAANRILADMPGGAVVFLAHGDKEAKTFRGAASIRQSSQGFIRMERTKGAVTIEVERLKGAAAGTKFKCRSEAVPMGVQDAEGREAIVFALTPRERIGGPAVTASDGSALGAVDDEQDEAAVLPAPVEEQPSREVRKAQEIAALADEAMNVLAESSAPLKRRELGEEILAKRLAAVRRQKDRERIGAPPEKKLDEAIARLIAERRIARVGSGRATAFQAAPSA